MGDELDAVQPQCAVCRQRDAIGLLHETHSEASPAHWYCVECLTEYLERDAALTAYPFLHLEPLPTPTWRPGRGQPHRRPFGRKML